MTRALMWFRNDLRWEDNPALAAATQHQAVIPCYVLDEIAATMGGAQKWWLHHSLKSLEKRLAKEGLVLVFKKGDALTILLALIQQYQITAVYWNRCYDAVSIERDQVIKRTLRKMGIQILSFNGSLLIEPWKVTTSQGSFYQVFTPFWQQCLKKIEIPMRFQSRSSSTLAALGGESLDEWKLLPKNPNWAKTFTNYWEPGELGAKKKLTLFIDHHLSAYQSKRNFPAEGGTSYLSPHIHFGEISVRDIWRAVQTGWQNGAYAESDGACFLRELGWREFSYYLLFHFPQLPTHNFKNKFNAFEWDHNPVAIKAWQRGQTGYPIIDAGMQELWQTGYMHNRVRMITASFLVKDLHIDWRIGANWFMDTLLDADLANNSASWQWVAGCGADAAPYFRIFNPTRQSQQFDPQGHYIRRWLPQLAAVSNSLIHTPWKIPDLNYIKPIINHEVARKEALVKYHQLMGSDSVDIVESLKLQKK